AGRAQRVAGRGARRAARRPARGTARGGVRARGAGRPAPAARRAGDAAAPRGPRADRRGAAARAGSGRGPAPRLRLAAPRGRHAAQGRRRRARRRVAGRRAARRRAGRAGRRREAAPDVRRALPLLLLAACGHAPDVPPSVAAGLPAPIVLVVVDTMRPDHTSLYGATRDTTPYLRELGQHAFVFDRAYATASWTRPSMASLFTSRLPESHGCEGRQGRLSPSLPTLPKLLAAQGWDTRAVVANGNLAPVWGFDQGWVSFRWVRGRPLWPYADAAYLQPVVEETLAQLHAPP